MKFPYDTCPECGDEELSFDTVREVLLCHNCGWEEEILINDDVLELEDDLEDEDEEV